MAFENIRTRFFYKALDAALTTPVRPRRRCREYVRIVVAPGSSRYDRVGALVGIVGTLVPGAERLVSKLLIRPRRLPFASRDINLLGAGSGSTVFVLPMGPRRNDSPFSPGPRAADGVAPARNTPSIPASSRLASDPAAAPKMGSYSCAAPLSGDRMVLKAYRRTIGQPPGALLRLASEYRRKYETISTWYAGPHDLVARAGFLILHGPMLGRPAVACVQRHVGGEKRDFFRDFDDEDLIGLLEGSPGLREQFVFFATRTLHEYTSRGRCADLLGPENLLVVREGESVRLKLIDYGILDVGLLKGEFPETLARVRDRMARIRSLLDHLAPGAEVS